MLNKDSAKSSSEQAPPSRPRTSALQPGSAGGEDPPRPKSEYGYSRSSLSHEVRPEDVVESDNEGGGARAKRFSLLKLRNFSESQLPNRAREEEERQARPPMPALPPSTSNVPSIVKTAPTFIPGSEAVHVQQEAENTEDAAERKMRPGLFKRSMSKNSNSNSNSGRTSPRKSTEEKRVDKRKSTSLRWRKLQGKSTGLEDLQRLSAMHVQNNNGLAPPSYGDESNSALALPVGHRFSESGGSEGSNASSDQIYGSTTTTTHTVSTHTTFFRLPRRNKNRNSLFPLPVKVPPPNDNHHSLEEPTTPRASTGQTSNNSLEVPSNGHSAPGTIQRRHTETSPTKVGEGAANLPSALAKNSLSFAEPGMNLFRNDSQRSRASSNSSPLQPPMRLGMRDRASTTSSFGGRNSHDIGTPPPMSGSGRNSTSTTGRSSLGGFLNLSRFRQSSDPHSPRHGSPGTRSKSNSFAMSREALVVPEREEGDTPSKYLERLEAAVAKSMIAGILSKSADPFAQAVLRSYTRRFPFFGEPIDMALRKFLLEADLPKETQQVDRVIQAFSDRYHECNPGVFLNSDQAYIIAFSLMMLHTDAFNKNNKRKMQKQDYIRNTSGQDVSDEVLACFYDNICYTPFVHYEEEVDINGERVLPFKPKKSKLKGAITESGKKPSGPVDPYNLLVEQKLDQLRPPIRDSITMEDPYNYRLTHTELDPNYLQRAFTHTGVLQIISQRSRPTAYEGQLTNMPAPNPQEMQVGIIDIKITKVGTLWRKSAKKKKTRSPWQEWGAILTGSQLYLFKNAHWAKGLVNQFLAAQRHGQPRTPVTFKPPLQEFKPDALIKTDNAVALVDATYTRHKHAFTLVRPGGQEEILLADNESELNDWLALINYAAAFRAAGVRIRGMVGGAEEDMRAKDVRRLESTQSSRSVQTIQTSNGGEISVHNRGLTPQLQRQVMAARRQIMVQKIGESKKEIDEAKKELDRMLRNARHILVLAPIAPRTRDEVMHAAAHADAMIKWTRRDIWRMKCHKDILAMDVRQDGVSASEVEVLADQSANEAAAPDSAKKTRSRDLSRLNSKTSATRSPPQSPKSPVHNGRPSMAGSLEANDVFRTPPESANMSPIEVDGFRIPPLHLDVLRQEAEAQEHRQSVATTSSSGAGMLSPSSPKRASLSHTSSASSIGRAGNKTERLHSAVSGTTDASEGASVPAVSPSRRSSTPDIDARELELMARTTMLPEKMEPFSARNPASLDGSTGAPLTSTPESSKHRSGVRRSLQKTLRDAHNHHSSVHRHRKGKDSDGTIRSHGENAEGAEDRDDATPGLKREKGAFMLHGKKASVVQFGNDWPNDRMRARREMWRQSTASSGVGGDVSDKERTPRQTSWHLRKGAGSPVVQDFGVESGTEDERETVASGDGEGPGFMGSPQSDPPSAWSWSPEQTRSAGRTHSRGEGSAGSAGEYFDIAWDSSKKGSKAKRETILGPKPSGERTQSVTSSEVSSAPSPTARPRANRDTVIGPRQQQQQKGRQESVTSQSSLGSILEGHHPASSSSLPSAKETQKRERKKKRTTVIGPSSASQQANGGAVRDGESEDGDASGEEDELEVTEQGKGEGGTTLRGR